MIESQLAERDILSAMLRSPASYTQVLGIVEPDDFQVPDYKVIAEVVWKMISERAEVTLPGVVFRIGNRVEQETITYIWRNCTDAMIQGVGWNAIAVKSYSEKKKALTLLADAQSKIRETPEMSDALIAEICSMLQTVSVNRNSDKVDISDMIKSEVNYLECKRTFNTGINWLDDLTGGIMVGRVWVIVAGYKMGKSTLARQMILEALQDGASIDWYNTETSPQDHYFSLLAQMASQRIVEYDPNMVIRPDDILRKNLTEAQKDVINDSRKQLNTYKGRLRIYGPSSGVSDPSVLSNILIRNKNNFGVDGAVVDHIQGLSGKGFNAYERINASLSTIRQTIHANGVFAILLSQMGEAAIREQTMGDAGYSSGAKGSGDINAEADELIVLTRGEDDKRGQIKIHLKLSRRNEPAFRWHTFFSGGVIGGVVNSR